MNAQREYRRLMDLFVECATSNVTVESFRRLGDTEPPSHNEDYPLPEVVVREGNFVRSLPKEQREVLFAMLERARTGGIHDLLAVLEHEISCNDLQLSRKGDNLGAEFEASLHYDFICRLEGDDWPDGD